MLLEMACAHRHVCLS